MQLGAQIENICAQMNIDKVDNSADIKYFVCPKEMIPMYWSMCESTDGRECKRDENYKN
jgi:hypothetical protein